MQSNIKYTDGAKKLLNNHGLQLKRNKHERCEVSRVRKKLDNEVSNDKRLNVENDINEKIKDECRPKRRYL